MTKNDCFLITFPLEQSERVYNDTHAKLWSMTAREAIYTMYAGIRNGYGCTVSMNRTLVTILLNFYDSYNEIREYNDEPEDDESIAITTLLREHLMGVR